MKSKKKKKSKAKKGFNFNKTWREYMYAMETAG